MRQLKKSAGVGAAILSAPLLLAASFAAHSQALEEITVTARKTTENLQEVPLAITALGAEQIDRLGVKDLSSLSEQDTSVQFDEGFTPSDTRITIRGLSPTRGRPNAAALIDGIDVTSEAVSNAGGSLLIDPRLVDVQRIEIVKGPQSALYGRSAFAGAIQYVTKDPADVLSGGVFVDYNIEGDEEIRGNVSIPITDTFGMRLNGLAWRKDGYYDNAATGAKLGDGKGSGATVTFKWEPSDTFNAKWRTDYSDDHFGVAAQALLNDFNTLYDLGNSGGLSGVDSEGRSVVNLAPQTGRSSTDSNGVPGFRTDYAGGGGQALDEYLRDVPGAGPSSDPILALNGASPALGQYDVNDPWVRNVYNQQVVSAFTGKFPDGDKLQPSIQPDYRLSSNPYDAEDFKGTDRRVFRNSLVAEWDINDAFVMTSYTGYTDADENTATDIGKYYRDNCRPDPNDTRAPEYRAQSDCTGGDGIHDGPISFFQDSFNSTQQLSQEFRLAWDINDSVKFTQGLQYWRERVKSVQFNSTTIVGGPQCILSEIGGGAIVDATFPPLGGPFGFDPVANQCGLTYLSSAYWADDGYRRISELGAREVSRGTNHYSWYGNLQWNVTDKFKTTFEARFTREDNFVLGPAQHGCLNGVSQDFFDNPDIPSKGIVSEYRDKDTGNVLCNGYMTNPDGTYDNAPGTDFGRIAGPGTVGLCGANGRCDTLDQAPAGGDPMNPAIPPYAAGLGWDPYGAGPQPSYEQKLKRKDRYWAPKLTLEYFWNDDIMTYFSWSRGIKPGGFSLLTLGAFGLDANGDGNYDEVEFEPERLDVWEVGAKTTLFDGRVRLNGSVFFQDFKDKQVTVQEVVGDVVGTRVRNISGSEIKGLEFDATFQATDNLRTTFGYTFLDSEYTDYTIITTSQNDIARIELGPGSGCAPEFFVAPDGSPFCVASFNGNELERTPKHSLLVNLNYTNNLYDTGLEWYSEVNFRYQDARWLEAFNIVEFPAYTRTNLSVGLLADTWDLQFYVTNVFDDDTITSGGGNPGIPTGSFGIGIATTAADGQVVTAGPKLPSDVYANMPNPRIFGARVNFRFGE